MTRYKGREDLQKRRDAWAAEIGRNSMFSAAAPRIVAELDRELAELEHAGKASHD